MYSCKENRLKLINHEIEQRLELVRKLENYKTLDLLGQLEVLKAFYLDKTVDIKQEYAERLLNMANLQTKVEIVVSDTRIELRFENGFYIRFELTTLSPNAEIYCNGSVGQPTTFQLKGILESKFYLGCKEYVDNPSIKTYINFIHSGYSGKRFIFKFVRHLYKKYKNTSIDRTPLGFYIRQEQRIDELTQEYAEKMEKYNEFEKNKKEFILQTQPLIDILKENGFKLLVSSYIDEIK